MGRKPNYQFDRMQRDKAKAEKKAARLAAKMKPDAEEAPEKKEGDQSADK